MPSPMTVSSTAVTLGFFRTDEDLDWRRDAACADLPQRFVFTKVPSEAEPVLRACNHCPIREECVAVVDPMRTWFDGVSGGRLWRNGREVRRAA